MLPFLSFYYLPESIANLRSRKGQLALVELQESLEVDKDALGSLRSQEAPEQSGGPDVSLEHEIELHRGGEFVSGDRRLDLELVDDVLHLLGTKVVQPHSEIVATCLRLGCRLLLGFHLEEVYT